MGRMKIFFCTLVLTNLCLGIEFRNIGPGGGGTAGALAVDPQNPQIAYVGLDCGGMHVTLDGGETWKNANIGIDYDGWVDWNNHYGLLVLPTGRVITTTDTGRIYLSDNHGQTWQKVFVTPGGLGFLLQSSHDPKTIFTATGRGLWERGRGLTDKPAGPWTGSIFVSRQSGQAGSWAKLNTDPKRNIPAGAYIFTLAVDYQDAKVMYAATDFGMFLSRDGGVSWDSIQNGLGRACGKQVLTIPGKPGLVYTSLGEADVKATDGRFGVYRSLDYGKSWNPMCKGIPSGGWYMALAVDPLNSKLLYLTDCSWGGGLYRSIDGGEKWSMILSTDIVKNTKGLNSPRNANWHPDGFHAVGGYSIWVGGPDKDHDGISDMIYFLGDNIGVTWKSESGGKDWQQISSRQKVINGRAFYRGRGEMELLCARRIVVDPVDVKHLWVSYFDYGLYESVDGGKSFAMAFGPWVQGELIGACRGIAIDPDNPKIVFSANGYGGSEGTGGVLTNIGGQGFWIIGGRAKNVGRLPNGSVLELIITKWKENKTTYKYLYATSGGNGVYRFNLINGDGNWEKVSDGLDKPESKDFHFMTGIPGTRTFFVSTGNGIYRTENGKKWVQLTGPGTGYKDIFAAQSIIVDPRNLNRIYVSMMRSFRELPDQGIYISEDGGKTWAKIAVIPVPYEMAFDPTAKGTVLYVASQCGGVYKVSQPVKGGEWKTESFANNSNGMVNARCWTVTVDPHNSKRIYAGCHGRGVFVGE
jgi:photosystem II stability/assembly factor-like uncharacterized protein